jgi:NitT/TauT family transport system permease protein
LLFFVAWQALPSLGLVNPVYFPPLSKVLADGLGLGLPTVAADVASSLGRILLGFALGAVAALPAGLALALAFKPALRMLNPLMTFLSQIPPFILFPVFVLLFKVGETGIIAVIFWSVFWPILFAAIGGASRVDGLLIRSARSMGATKARILARVILPWALPTVLTGMRYSLTFAFMMLINAESMGSYAGMGYELFVASRRAEIPEVYFMVLVIAVVGLAVNWLFELLERRLTRWRGAEGRPS